MRTSLDLHSGVGSGYTIYNAEQHVQMAFEYAAKENSDEIIHVNEEGYYTSISGNQQQEDSPDLQLPAYWIDVLKRNNYRDHIPMKVYQYVKLKDMPFFTSDIMTVLLKNTDRNSRRILSELEKMKLIRAVPEETSSGKRGRPKKIYELVMEEK